MKKIRLSVPEVTGEVNAKKRHSIGQSADGNGFRTLFYFYPFSLPQYRQAPL